MKPDTTKPVRLLPVDIPKPWGREIWYTGMEARGESLVMLEGGATMPLSRFLEADPDGSCNRQNVLLLKILDPKSEPVIGDLYFEVHEEKREVYIVTGIHEGASQGHLRWGMNQTLRRQHSSDDEFRQAFLQAVKRYEAIRRRIDDEGAILEAEEALAREQMNRFTNLQTLNVGDVIRVPTFTPHALQHGVRVVEFQTQSYERLIISFAQKVLTQRHWDSAIAIEKMNLDLPPPAEFEPVQEGVERIARFEDFNVWRGAARFELPSHLAYAVVMAVGGNLRVGDLTLAGEEACFVPRQAVRSTICEPLSDASRCLVAAPQL